MTGTNGGKQSSGLCFAGWNHQYLVGPEVWQAVQHSVSLNWILLLSQFKQHDRNQGGGLQGNMGLC